MRVECGNISWLYYFFLQISHPSFFLSSFSILCSLSVNQASFFLYTSDGWIFCHLHLRPWPTMKWAPTHQQDLISTSSLSSLCPPSSQSPPVHYTTPARPMPSPNASKNCSECHFILTLFEHQKF